MVPGSCAQAWVPTGHIFCVSLRVCSLHLALSILKALHAIHLHTLSPLARSREQKRHSIKICQVELNNPKVDADWSARSLIADSFGHLANTDGVPRVRQALSCVLEIPVLSRTDRNEDEMTTCQ